MKRRRVKSLFAMMMAATMLLGSACGSTGQAGGNAVQTDTAAQEKGDDAEKETAELEPVTLHFIFFGDKKAASDEVWDAIADYTRDTLNCDYDVQFIAGTDYSNKLMVKAAAGDAWDLNFDSNWTGYYSMVTKDAYMNLDELLPKYAPDLYAAYEGTGALDAAKSKGHIVALPWTMTMNTRDFIQWRGDLVEQAGIEVDKESLKTIEGIDKLFYQLHEAFPDKYIQGNTKIIYSMEGLCDLGHGLCFNLNDPECKVMPIEDTETFRIACEYAEKWQNDGIIWKDVLTDGLDKNSLIQQGKIISRWGSHENCYINVPWAEEGAYWDFTEIYPDGLYANRTPLANAMCIPATSENPERTLMFLNMLETDQTLYDMVHYGIEGVTYELEGEEAVFPEGMDASNSNYMEWGGRWALWKPQFMRPDASYGKDFWVNEAEFAASTPNNVVSPLEGFNFEADNVKTEIAQRDQIYNDAWKVLEVGLAGGYEEAIAKLKSDSEKAGLSKVLEEYQKQVDEFLANK